MKVDQLQIGLDIRVKFQTSPSAQLNFKVAEERLRLEGRSFPWPPKDKNQSSFGAKMAENPHFQKDQVIQT